MSGSPTIDRLLNLVPDSPAVVLEELRQHPEIASAQDGHGYSLIHAAASYGHVDLLRALVRDMHVDVNMTDEDGETALFSVEAINMAQELLDLGIAADLKNDQGQTAAEKLDDEDEQPEIAAYLRGIASRTVPGGARQATIDGKAAKDDLHDIPPVPNGMNLSIGTMPAADAGEAPDPELRRRIEELAARPDFHEETGQRELRELVSQVVSGMSSDERSASRRRLS